MKPAIKQLLKAVSRVIDEAVNVTPAELDNQINQLTNDARSKIFALDDTGALITELEKK